MNKGRRATVPFLFSNNKTIYIERTNKKYGKISKKFETHSAYEEYIGGDIDVTINGATLNNLEEASTYFEDKIHENEWKAKFPHGTEKIAVMSKGTTGDTIMMRCISGWAEYFSDVELISESVDGDTYSIHPSVYSGGSPETGITLDITDFYPLIDVSDTDPSDPDIDWNFPFNYLTIPDFYKVERIEGTAILPNVSICNDEPTHVHYNSSIPSIKALKFSVVNKGEVQSIYNDSNDYRVEFEYSFDGKTWEYLPQHNDSAINFDDYIYVRGKNLQPSYDTYDVGIRFWFSTDVLFDVEGELYTLLDYDDPTIVDRYTGGEAFGYCFTGAPIRDASKLILPPPFGNRCYQHMFYKCTSLTTAPELPATTLTDTCYQSMFEDCTSLTTAPELPATTLANYCYRNMFFGCTNLNNITMLATDITAYSCLTNWTCNVATTGTFTKKAGVSIPSGGNGIPNGWTIIEV